MKLKLTEIYIFEAKCPECGSSNAWSGSMDTECSNLGCPKFSQKAAAYFNKNTSSKVPNSTNTRYKTIDKTNVRQNDAGFIAAIALNWFSDHDRKYYEQFINDLIDYLHANSKSSLRIPNDDRFEKTLLKTIIKVKYDRDKREILEKLYKHFQTDLISVMDVFD